LRPELYAARCDQIGKGQLADFPDQRGTGREDLTVKTWRLSFPSQRNTIRRLRSRIGDEDLKEIPDVETCPKCAGPFHVKARTVEGSLLPSGVDELDWKCSRCGYEQIEKRRKVNGVIEHWPPSTFQHDGRAG
jgi:rubredoxin